MSINISKFSLFTKYGLLVTDTDVYLVCWKKGALEKVAVFANDESGVERFSLYLQKNEKLYNNQSFYILVDVIGEDYRLEKVAHLIGKFKADFHKRRITQLFRGSRLAASFTQGREEQGRRDDIVLFYGILTENKVLPWMQAVARSGGRYLAGVYASSFVAKEILKSANSNWSKSNSLLITMQEKGLMRQTFFLKGQPRFSRVSRIESNTAEEVAQVVKRELDRTLQYIGSLKISMVDGISVETVCPGAMVGQLREMLQGSDKIKYNFHDAFSLSKKLGMSKSLGEIGQDSSLSVHSMFSFIRWNQLADFSLVRFHRLKFVGSWLVTAFVAYALFAGVGISGDYLEGWERKTEADSLEDERRIKQTNYDAESSLSQTPPSTPANIAAISKTFRLLSQLRVSPSQIFYYFSRGLAENTLVQVNNMKWYITNNTASGSGMGAALFSDGDIFQVLEVSGEFLPVPGETYLNVADRADLLINSLDQGRSDILVEAVELPGRELDDDSLEGVLEEGFAIDAARNRAFKIRIIWKEYEDEAVKSMAEQI